MVLHLLRVFANWAHGLLLCAHAAHAQVSCAMEASVRDAFADALSTREQQERLHMGWQVEVGRYMSRSLISVVHIFEGCNDNFLDSLSILLHEVPDMSCSYAYCVPFTSAIASCSM